MARKPRAEGAEILKHAVAHKEVAPLGDLASIVAAFKREHPAQWDALRLCPLQHGLDAMIERLKA